MINRKKFLDTARETLFDGNIKPSQLAGMEAVLNEWERRELTDLRWLAYIFGTEYHEVGKRMQPIEENLNYGAQGLADTFPVRCAVSPKETPKVPNEKAKAIARKPISIANYVYAHKNGNGDEASGDGWLFRGRGLPQTTGRANYKKFGCENNPDKMLELDLSVKSMFDGMLGGLYTGVSLADCFNNKPVDPKNPSGPAIKARLIINGRDKAQLIAGYYAKFLEALG